MIVIVDHGMGNLGSVHNMLRKLGADAVRSADPDVVAGADKLILAGIGAYDGASTRLAELGLVDALETAALERQVPVVGVCLGMQLMARTSEEGIEPGLGWIDAEVRRFSVDPERPLRVPPHMGWQEIDVTRPNPAPRHVRRAAALLLLARLSPRLPRAGRRGRHRDVRYAFAAAILHDNLYGTQFHPEKSHVFGFEVYRRFIELEP